MKREIVIDKNKCIHCGMCIRDCITSCIEFGSDNFPVYNGDNCFECQHCMAICPAGALSFGGVNPANLEATGYANSDDLLRLIKSRRSVRQYKNENIPTEIFEKIKNMLPYAPTGCNVDGLHFSFIETKEKMQEFRDLAQEKGLNSNFIFRTATAMIAVAVDKSKSLEVCQSVDPVIALSYIDLYAQSLGLGTLWCGLAYDVAMKVPEMYSLFEIPQGYTLGYVMLLGIPAVKYQRTTKPDAWSIKELR